VVVSTRISRDCVAQHVLIETGSGLGRVLAKAFLVNGASVTLVDIVDQRLQETKQELASLKEQLSLSGTVNTYVISNGVW
jgi:NADP-dependent 3-hydroxy acid dehydrogenase YdfG